LTRSQPYNPFKLVLTLQRATEKASAILSALSALREYRRASICATVGLCPTFPIRLTPERLFGDSREVHEQDSDDRYWRHKTDVLIVQGMFAYWGSGHLADETAGLFLPLAAIEDWAEN
jgi:hypothetical protein